MRIAVVTRFMNGRLEGIGHHTHEMLKRLSNRHPDISWHLINDGKEGQIQFAQSNVEQHSIGPVTRHPLLWYYWYEYRLPRLLGRIQPDVIWYPDGLMSLKSPFPSLLTVHDLAYLHFPEGTIGSHRRYLQWLMPQQLKLANRIACVSNYTQQGLNEFFEFTTDKTFITYNAADAGFAPNIEVEQVTFREKYTNGQPYFLYLGSIHPRKNIGVLIQAYELYKKDHPQSPLLVIAGRWAWKSQSTRDALNNSRCRDSIILLDQIDDIIYPLVGAARAMINVSLLEGFGMPVLESIQSGVPVITTGNSAMAEIAGEAAFYVNPTNIDEIANAMFRMDTDETLRSALIQKGMQQAQQYSWDNAAEILLEKFDIIGKK